jgi:APA family basic amino acid/polyamine antiporter
MACCPGFLAQVHPATKVPWAAIVANGVILALLALTDAMKMLATVGSFLYVLQFIFPLLALLVVRRRSKTIPSFRTPAPYLVLPLALGGCLLLLVAALYASGQEGIGIGLGWLMAGLLTYATVQALLIYQHRKHRQKKGYAATKEEPGEDQISSVLTEA